MPECIPREVVIVFIIVAVALFADYKDQSQIIHWRPKKKKGE